MNGLFNQLRSAATSPLALGLLGGAAIGSPGFGLLMAPIIGAAQENAARNKTAAEQALEARALELEQARRAEQGAQGLLAALSAPTISDAMVGPPRPGVMRETDFRQSPQGLLFSAAQMNPAAVGETLLSQMTARPEPQRALSGSAGYLQQYFGRVPTPDEVIEFDRRRAAAKPESPSDALARFQLEQGRQEAAAEEAERRRAAAASAAQTSGMLASAGTLFDTATQLELSENLMQPGGIFAQAPGELISGVAKGFGVFGDEERANSILSDLQARNTLSKTAEDFVIQLGDEIGANTNAQRQSIRDSFANIELDTGTIFYATAREMDRLISRAEAQGIEVPNLEQYRATAKRLKELALLSPEQRRMELQDMREQGQAVDGGQADAPQPPISNLLDTSAIRQGAANLGANFADAAGDLTARGQQLGGQAADLASRGQRLGANLMSQGQALGAQSLSGAGGVASTIASRAGEVLRLMQSAGDNAPSVAATVRQQLEALTQESLASLSAEQQQELTRLYQMAVQLSEGEPLTPAERAELERRRAAAGG